MSLFQYLLQDISMQGARIILPQWVVKRELLHQEDRIDFHLPFLFEGETFNKGSVAWAKWDEAMGGLVCGVRIDVRAPLYYPVFVSFEGQSITMDMSEFQSSEYLLGKILKDTIGCPCKKSCNAEISHSGESRNPVFSSGWKRLAPPSSRRQ